MSSTVVAFLFSGALVIAIVMGWRRYGVRRVLVSEGFVGLIYRHGRYVTQLGPGGRWFRSHGLRVSLVDVRERNLVVAAQEILTSDSVPVKVSLVARYVVSAPTVALHEVTSYEQDLYFFIQLALRETVSRVTVEELLGQRLALNAELSSRLRERSEAIGVEIRSAEVRDLMLPGDLKQVYRQVLRARQETLAALERARGQQAVLRSLKNTARLLEDDDALVKLRVLELVERLGEGERNTIMVDLHELLGKSKPRQ